MSVVHVETLERLVFEDRLISRVFEKALFCAGQFVEGQIISEQRFLAKVNELTEVFLVSSV